MKKGLFGFILLFVTVLLSFTLFSLAFASAPPEVAQADKETPQLEPVETSEITVAGVSTEALAAPAITLSKTVGTDPSVCPTTDEITVAAGTEATYCYKVTNTGDVTLTRHALNDSELGTILNNFPHSLVPGASAFLTQTTTINATTVNSATWTAYNPGPTDVATATDTATVNVTGPSLFCNATPILIPGSGTAAGPAAPYPSDIAVR